MGSSTTSRRRTPVATLTLFVVWATVAFVPAVGDIRPAGVSLTAWLLAGYMFCVPVLSLLATGEQDD